MDIHLADLKSLAPARYSNAKGWKQGSLHASGTKDSHVFGVFGLRQTPLHMSHHRVSAALGMRLAGLHCIVAGRASKKPSSSLGRALSSPASIVWSRSSGCRCSDKVQPQVLPLCCARIRYGKRSLGEPRSRAKSARPTPVIAFSPQHHKLYQATLSVQGLRKE
ncbi:hypothetical protein HDV63DRAFT_305731 [Trichoderma sp. SZMC 28014]